MGSSHYFNHNLDSLRIIKPGLERIHLCTDNKYFKLWQIIKKINIKHNRQAYTDTYIQRNVINLGYEKVEQPMLAAVSLHMPKSNLKTLQIVSKTRPCESDIKAKPNCQKYLNIICLDSHAMVVSRGLWGQHKPKNYKPA